jgi:hypothetical protein
MAKSRMPSLEVSGLASVASRNRCDHVSTVLVIDDIHLVQFSAAHFPRDLPVNDYFSVSVYNG